MRRDQPLSWLRAFAALLGLGVYGLGVGWVMGAGRCTTCQGRSA